MEIICRIIEQGALTVRKYTDKNGQPQQIAFVPFVLAQGTSTIYAELTGEAASKCGPLDPNHYYLCNLSAFADRYTDKNGDDRGTTKMYINKLSIL